MGDAVRYALSSQYKKAQHCAFLIASLLPHGEVLDRRPINQRRAAWSVRPWHIIVATPVRHTDLLQYVAQYVRPFAHQRFANKCDGEWFGMRFPDRLNQSDAMSRRCIHLAQRGTNIPHAVEGIGAKHEVCTGVGRVFPFAVQKIDDIRPIPESLKLRSHSGGRLDDSYLRKALCQSPGERAGARSDFEQVRTGLLKPLKIRYQIRCAGCQRAPTIVASRILFPKGLFHRVIRRTDWIGARLFVRRLPEGFGGGQSQLQVTGFCWKGDGQGLSG